MMNVTIHELHRIAVAINNAGVSLLQRGATQQAFEVFHHAVAIMKNGVFAKLDTMKVTDAHQLLHESKTKLFENSHRACNDNVVKPIVYCDQDLSTMVSIIQFGPTPSHVYPLIMELIDSEDEFSIHISSGIFLYNYGLAHYLRSRDETIKSIDNRTIVSSAASRLLEMSYQIMLHNSKQCEESQSRHTHFALGVGGMVLSTLAQLYLDQDKQDLANEAMESAINIVLILHDAHGEVFPLQPMMAAAA
jgi:hypothetical protein